MTDVRDWTFVKLRRDERVPTSDAVGAVAADMLDAPPAWRHSCKRTLCGVFCVLGALGVLFGIGWAATDGYYDVFVAADMSTGSFIFSAMELRAQATGNRTDDDLEQIVHFVVSDMGGLWTYRELEQRGGVRRMDTVLFYGPEYAQSDRYAYNAQLKATLPSRLDYHKNQEDPNSCICGWNNVISMQILYSSYMRNVAVVAHEYYHVLQIHHCPTVYDDRTHFVMWISEGAAAVLENLYLTRWLQTDPAYQDVLFTGSHGHVNQMLKRVQADTFTYDSSLNSHEGALTNYMASTTALLYLIYRKGGSSYLRYIFVDFLFGGDCDLAANGGMDEGFRNAFGTWTTVNDFYADLNAFLRSANASSIEQLRPSNASIYDLFNHETLCSDICVTSRNGVCDDSCPYGSDCTDCGSISLPHQWPIPLR